MICLALSPIGDDRLAVFSFVPFLLSLLFLSLFGGYWEQEIGSPTRIEHFDQGQEMVM